MQPMPKLVSVIVPTYRRPKALDACIRSVLSSNYAPFEIIVADDNADDAFRMQTAAAVERLAKKHGNIRYVCLPEHKNGSAARNAGFRASIGEYVMFLDDDDLFLPCKMSAQAAFLDTHDDTWGACYTRYVDLRDGRVIGRSAENREGELLVEELARNLFIHGGSNLMVRRGVVERLGGFDECFERNQDQEFLIRMLKAWKLGFADVEGLVVNIHPRPNVDNIEVTKRFVSVFAPEINALPETDRRVVKKMLALQDVRAALWERHAPMLALRIMREGGVTLRETAGYLAHLVRRKRKRISCGYDLSRLRR